MNHIFMPEFKRFTKGLNLIKEVMLDQGESVHTGHWQSKEGGPQSKTIELPYVAFVYQVPPSVEELQGDIRPNLPWAENHFLERVAGVPLNPGREYQNWPWYKGNVEDHKEGGTFSHTYMERYWPKAANWPIDGPPPPPLNPPHCGIRFPYGDLNDVVSLLIKYPHTRQAYLPVWFPEDTGAVHGERVPCSLGYHFMIRNNRLSVMYHMRSCDLFRYLQDDIYLTARLAQWVAIRVSDGLSGGGVTVGEVHMNIASLHIFEAERSRLRREVTRCQNSSLAK